MTTHQCSVCKKEFKYNWQLQRHFNRKIKCKEPKEEVQTKIVEIENNIANLKENQDKLLENQDKIKQYVESLKKIEENNSINILSCEYCDKHFNSLSNLIQHKKRCKKKNDNISIYERQLGIESLPEIPLTCKFCCKKFTKQSSYSRHISNECKEKKEYEKKLKEKVYDTKIKAVEQKEINQQIYNNTHIHGNQNNTINIIMPHMNGFGNENLDYLDVKVLKKELRKLPLNKGDITIIMSKITELIHANPAHPENQNVLFRSLNGGHAQVYQVDTKSGKGNFQSRPMTQVQDQIIQNVGKIIGPVADETTGTELSNMLDNMEDKMYDGNEDLEDGKVTRNWSACRQAVKGTLYDSRKEIQTTQKLVE